MEKILIYFTLLKVSVLLLVDNIFVIADNGLLFSLLFKIIYVCFIFITGKGYEPVVTRLQNYVTKARRQNKIPIRKICRYLTAYAIQSVFSNMFEKLSFFKVSFWFFYFWHWHAMDTYVINNINLLLMSMKKYASNQFIPYTLYIRPRRVAVDLLQR